MSLIMAKVASRKLFDTVRATLMIVSGDLMNIDFLLSEHLAFLNEFPDRVYQIYDFWLFNL